MTSTINHQFPANRDCGEPIEEDKAKTETSRQGEARGRQRILCLPRASPCLPLLTLGLLIVFLSPT